MRKKKKRRSDRLCRVTGVPFLLVAQAAKPGAALAEALRRIGDASIAIISSHRRCDRRGGPGEREEEEGEEGMGGDRTLELPGVCTLGLAIADPHRALHEYSKNISLRFLGNIVTIDIITTVNSYITRTMENRERFLSHTIRF